MRRPSHIAIAVAIALSFNATAQTAGYSAAPLQKPMLEPAKVLVESVAVNNWLNANVERLTPQQTQAVRERVHSLIDSRVKELYLRDKTILPKESDPVLATLYSWAGRLGVFGADKVYARVRGSYPVHPPPGPRAPMGIAIALDADTLKVTSGAGKWEAAIPYYFFVFALQNAPDADGRRVEAMIASTGTAPDDAAPGYSQATLAVFFSPGQDMDLFAGVWAARLGIPLTLKEEAVALTQYKSRKYYDSATRLHKEAVFISSATGNLAVLYSGLDGTYQWNRPHFLDFLAHLKVAR